LAAERKGNVAAADEAEVKLRRELKLQSLKSGGGGSSVTPSTLPLPIGAMTTHAAGVVSIQKFSVKIIFGFVFLRLTEAGR